MDADRGGRTSWGCDVRLRPQVLGRTVTIASSGTRMKAIGVGELEVRKRALVVTGALVPIDAGTSAALVACDATVVIDAAVAHSDYALPLTRRTVAEMLALVDALAPYLAPPSGTAAV